MSIRIAVLSVAAVAATASAQNRLVDGGFEGALTYDGPPFVGFWEAFSGAANSNAVTDTGNPLSGAQHASLFINGDDNSFAGVFQDVAVTAGETITWGGMHARGTMDLNIGIEYRIEFRDSVNNIEISRTPNSTMAPTSMDYEMFSLSALVPTGADLARVVYAIQTFGGDGDGSNTGTVYLDDVYVIPAPAAAGMLGFAGLVATRRRR